MSRIVVGVDGSETGRAALSWAFDEAALRDWPVVVVHAYTNRPFGTETVPLPGPALDLASAAEALVQREIGFAHNVAHAAKIETVIAEGGPARLLTNTALPGDILVVGSRGRGGFVGLLLGSTSQQVVSHADCPVLVVR